MTRTRIYRILQAMVCVLAAVLLSLSAARVYREGAARRAENPRAEIYTRQGALEALGAVAPLLFIGIGFTLAGWILGAGEDNARRPVKDAEGARDLVVSQVARPSEAMQKERAAERRLLRAGWALFALCMAPIALYVTNAEHFPLSDLEGMFHGLLRVFLPCAALGIGALAVTSFLREKHVLRETEAAQARLKEERAEGLRPEKKAPVPERNRGALQAAIAILAVLLIVLGVMNQSARDVLYKAITICTECVGLG